MKSKRLNYVAASIFLVAVLLAPSIGLCKKDGYVRVVAKARPEGIHLGPTGIRGYGPEGPSARPTGVDDPNFFIVDRVEFGSPAYQLVRINDIITGVNGKAFLQREDPRVQLAYAIIDSEVKDGKLSLQITHRGVSKDVVITLPRVPDYSPTWPFDCPRTELMLKNACDYLALQQAPNGKIEADDGFIGPTQAGLLWLAMGEPLYLENARRAAYWFSDMIQKLESKGEILDWGPWGGGYGGLLLAEYYQMTGDRQVLPGLEIIAKQIARGQMPSGGWSHGFFNGFSAGYGEVNCAGMSCYMVLVLAKECGVKVDEHALRLAEKYYEKFAPTLTSRYGDMLWGWKDVGYTTMNGKISGLAVAHLLNGHKADSTGYALKAARSFDHIEGGHTGHFFNLLWSPVAASLAPAKEYRRAMNQIGWYYALSRDWRGGFQIQPRGRRSQQYCNKPDMTTGGVGLSLAVWKRHLRIHGAPKSVFVRTLPAELEAARTLHQSNQWDQAIAAVDAFLKKNGLDAETIRQANELRDKVRYVKASVEMTLATLDTMTMVKQPRLNCKVYEVDHMLKTLDRLLGTDDPRLKVLYDRLPDKQKKIWARGKSFHESITALKQVRTEAWFIYSAMVTKILPSLSVPIEEPAWSTIATASDAGGPWKTLMVAKPTEAPKGWTHVSFDDGGWTGAPTQGKKRSRGRSKIQPGYRLVRVPFDLKSTKAKGLRLGSGSSLSTGAKVYLNGELVVVSYNGAGKGNIDLLKEVSELLLEGRNVLAYTTTDPKGKWTQLTLQAQMLSDADSLAPAFAWTETPGRDADYRKLTAKRDVPQPYYQAEKDKRTVTELMQVMQAEPFFMPEAYYAIQRIDQLVPVAKQQKVIATLLKSSSWGSRWSGLAMMRKAIAPLNSKAFYTLSAKQRATIETEYKPGQIICASFEARIIELLKDSNVSIRLLAADILSFYFGSPKEAIPALVALLQDTEGQNWFVRKKAWNTLQGMPLDEVMRQVVMQAGLKDPGSYVRGAALGMTFLSKDKAKQADAAKTYKQELIDQLFDAPHGMATGKARFAVAPVLLDQLSKKELRPYLPRFFKGLEDSTGGTLTGSMLILVSFGDEVRGKLEVLTRDKNETVRCNALETLQQMAMKNDASPKLVKRVIAGLKPLMTSDNINRAAWARRLMLQIEAQKSGEK